MPNPRRRTATPPSPKARRPMPDASAPRTNLYDDVTARIIADLEGGRLPWVQSWGRAGAPGPGLPRNALTGRAYSGVCAPGLPPIPRRCPTAKPCPSPRS